MLKYAGPQIGRPARRRTLRERQPERHRARNTLVVVQVALALVLLIGSGLMIRTFQALRSVTRVRPRPRRSRPSASSFPGRRCKSRSASSRMHQAIIDKIAAVPGVTSVALTSIVR